MPGKHREKKQQFRCGVDGRKITRQAPTRMDAVRRHYKDAHPRQFREMTRKAQKTRAENR